MPDITALRAAVEKLKSTSDAVVAEVKSWDTGSSSTVSQADVDALVAEVESIEGNLAGASSSSPPTAVAGAPTPGASPPAAAEPATLPKEAPQETVQPPWQASS